ncbi:hypothetical protein ACJMK2_042911, partial [Sinanodonta woodiana]
MLQTDSITQKVSVVQPDSVRFTNEPHIESAVVSLSLSQFSQTLTIEHQSSGIEVMPTSHYSSSALVYPSHSESRSIEVIQSPWSRPQPGEMSTEIRSSTSRQIMPSDVSVDNSILHLSYTTLSTTHAFDSSQDLHASSHSKASLAPTDEMSYQPSLSYTKAQIYQSSYTDRIFISTIHLSSSQKVDLPVASTYTKVQTADPQPIFVSHNQTFSYSINAMLQSTPEFPKTKEINYTNMAVQSTSVVHIDFAMTTSALESSILSTSTAATSAASTTQKPNTTVRTTKITSPTTTASCVAKIADVVFVIDSSGSIGADNFLKLKEFMKNIVRTFDIDSRYTRVAVIKYNDYPNIEFKLNNHTNLNDLLAAIDAIKYTTGGTNTADAIQLMRSEGFDRERPAAPNIGIVITDGLSKYPTLTKGQAELARNDGITLFAIGVGNETEQEELMNIGSGDRVYHVEGFDALETINSAVAHTTCGVNLNESFVTRSTTSPRTTPSGCADYDDNCGSYGRDSCYDYEPFARGHCPKSCGFCRDVNANTTKVCADTIKDCAQYGVEMCYKESQHDWVDANCQKFCGFCGDKHAPLPMIPYTTIATTTEALCNDSIPNCHEYGGPSMCKTFGQWARQNCAKYCSVCFNYVHVTASTVGNK